MESDDHQNRHNGGALTTRSKSPNYDNQRRDQRRARVDV
jgi:hypothetical protein